MFCGSAFVILVKKKKTHSNIYMIKRGFGIIDYCELFLKDLIDYIIISSHLILIQKAFN